MNETDLFRLLDTLRGNSRISTSRELWAEMMTHFRSVDHARAILENNMQLLGGFEDVAVPAPFVKHFLSLLLSERQVLSVMDPWAGMGSLLRVVNAGHPEAKLNGINLNASLSAYNKLVDAPFDEVTGNPVSTLHQDKHQYDLIVSNLPIAVAAKEQWRGLPILDMSFHITIEAFGRLKPDGMMVVSIGPAIFGGFGAKFIEVLHADGGRIKAIFSAPVRSLNANTIVPINLMVIEHGSQQDVFQAEIPEDATEQQTVLTNYRNHRLAKQMSQGVLTPISKLRSIAKLTLDKEVDILLKRSGMPIRPMFELGEFKLARDIKGDWIAIHRSPHRNVFKGIDPHSVDVRNCLLFEVDSNQARIGYLIEVLNSPLGNKLLSAVSGGSVMPMVSRMDLEQLRLPIPSVLEQNAHLKFNSEVDELKEQLILLQSALWKSPKQILDFKGKLKRLRSDPKSIEWMEDLPFPLASILWGYHSEIEVSRKKDYLSFFFEALAEFLSILLLSSLRSNSSFYDSEVKAWIRNEKMKNWHLSTTFGNWIYLFSNLAKQVRKLKNGQKDEQELVYELFAGGSIAYMDMVTSSTVIKVLESVANIRNNTKGHGGISSDEKDRDILSALESHFNEVRYILIDGFSSMNLIRPVPNKMAWDDETENFNIDCQSLSGTRSKFKTETFVVSSPLTYKKMYILHDDQLNATEVLPFVQMRESPRTEEQACYFYNRVQGNEIRLVSYHHDKEAEILDPITPMTGILQLLNPQD